MNLPFRALRRWSACLAGLVTVLPSGLAAKTWTDRGPEFRAGTLGNAGQNLQVNRHGAIETIRRYDVDGDGRIDLLSNSGHDMYYALPAALVRAGAGGALQVDELRVDGSSRVVPADLNRDGFMDLVFLPNVSNVQYAHRASLRIAWGRADGWSSSRITRQLPVNGGFGAEDSWLPKARVAVGDLNGDGWPDIVTLNSEGWLFGQPAGRIVRTYWGGAEGPYLGQYHELGVAGALELATGGFGARREHPAVVLTAAGELHYLGPDAAGKGVAVVRRVPLPLSPAAGSAPVKVQCLAVQPGTGGAGDVLWIGTDSDLVFRVGPGATAGEIRAIPARPATHLAVGRLDDDAFPDLVLTNLKLVFRTELTRASHVAPVEILWGTADGVDVRGAASLKVLNAISATIGDLNADGHGDLLVSVHQGDVTMQASSRVYFGDGSRRLPAEGRPVPTEGAQEAVITRVTPDSPPVAVIANSMSYTLDAAVPALLYWGGEKGFSPDDKVEIPNLGGLKSSLSDLNGDGHVDLVIINGGDVTPAAIARAPHVGANIYWGGPEGPIG
ncbi:MAG: VCBS repeat-containing protein, partial [Opitutaceae bacterium]|nr:VCBS repeat-containing protein [Opitutaceae bacterium]